VYKHPKQEPESLSFAKRQFLSKGPNRTPLSRNRTRRGEVESGRNGLAAPFPAAPYCETALSSLSGTGIIPVGVKCAAGLQNSDRGIGYGIIMATWRRMFLVAHVWLTAFMMLFAGLPHVRCQCPTEHDKPIRPSIPFQIGKCCGAGSCCTPAPEGDDRSGDTSIASEAEQVCCCCHTSTMQNADKKEQCGQLESLGCKRALTDADPVLSSSQEPVNAGLISWMLISDTAPTFLALPRQAGDSSLSWQSHEKPPPTDLVLTLQHILI
jgi:hypothetical protein